MSALSLYPFIEEDRIENRNTYFYVPFNGTAFIDEWCDARGKALDTFGCPPPVTLTVKPCDAPIAVPAETQTLLMALAYKLETGILDDAECKVLNKLVQRFEVTKRVHCYYPITFRPDRSVSYLDLNLYVLFAHVMNLAYARLGKLYYLNALIKLLDTLSSVCDRLNDEEKSAFAALVESERNHLQPLAAIRQVTL